MNMKCIIDICPPLFKCMHNNGNGEIVSRWTVGTVSFPCIVLYRVISNLKTSPYNSSYNYCVKNMK